LRNILKVERATATKEHSDEDPCSYNLNFGIFICNLIRYPNKKQQTQMGGATEASEDARLVSFKTKYR